MSRATRPDSGFPRGMLTLASIGEAVGPLKKGQVRLVRGLHLARLSHVDSSFDKDVVRESNLHGLPHDDIVYM